MARHPPASPRRWLRSTAPQYPAITLRLPRPDNTDDFQDRLIGRVRHLIRVEAGRDDAAVFVRRAYACRCHDDLIALIRDTVTVLP